MVWRNGMNIPTEAGSRVIVVYADLIACNAIRLSQILFMRACSVTHYTIVNGVRVSFANMSVKRI